MAGEFTKPTSVTPAIVGNIANPDEYNQNIAAQSKSAIVGIDEDGNFSDVNIGDETLGTNGTLIVDIKLREDGVLKFYNSSGVHQNDVNLGQATESLIGQAEIATQAEVDAITDDTRFITPLKLGNGFGVSLGTNGWIQYPDWLGGLLSQWGEYTDSSIAHGEDFSVSFHETFSNLYSLDINVNDQAVSVTSSSSVKNWRIISESTSGFTAEAGNTSGSSMNIKVRWRAIGN